MTGIGAYGFLYLLIVKGSTFAMSGATVSTFLNLAEGINYSQAPTEVQNMVISPLC